VQGGLHFELRKIAAVADRARRSLFFEGRIECPDGRGARWVLEVWSYNEEALLSKSQRVERDRLTCLWDDAMSGGGRDGGSAHGRCEER
jgi:hypothetical protein